MARLSRSDVDELEVFLPANTWISSIRRGNTTRTEGENVGACSKVTLFR
jgi:hypothetical protein